MSRDRRRYYRPELATIDLPEKANRILNLILIALILIVLRVWHLAVVQYDLKLEESRKPQRRVVVESAKRGTIRDRFNLPLAINKIQYQASIQYSQFKSIPSTFWETNLEGKRVKRSKRKEYISKLTHLLAKELNLDAERLEDLIHSKAAFYYQIPYVIKEDLTEKEYYRLKMLEKDWPGITVQILPRRHYPQGRVGADIIGYMGAINKQEYENIIHEMKRLEAYLERDEEMGEEVELPPGVSNQVQAKRRLKDLEDHAYKINDYIGKTGIEGRYEEELRGYRGKRSFYSDARGNFLRELPGAKEALSGQRILVTISSELQEYAEKLLAQNERIREAKVSGVDAAKQALLSLKQPWIKGGAIVVMEPESGEILTMASYPRSDPNDFIATGNVEINKQKRSNVNRWFENEIYLGDIWDQKRPLERELFDDEDESFYDEKIILDWGLFLKFILPKDNPVRGMLSEGFRIENAIEIQRLAERLLLLSGQGDMYAVFNNLYREDHVPYPKTALNVKSEVEENFLKNAKVVEGLKRKLDPWFNSILNCYDKVLLVDLCRLVVKEDLFTESLSRKVGKVKLSTYRNASAAMANVSDTLKEMVRELFHDISFKAWRLEHEKEFLQSKRLEEKNANKLPKPYVDHLDAKEVELFNEFWNRYRIDLILVFLVNKPNIFSEEIQPYLNHFIVWHDEIAKGAHLEASWRAHYIALQNVINEMDVVLAKDFLRTLRGFGELNRPLLGRYRHLRKNGSQQLEKHLAVAFYPLNGFGYGRSQAYRQAATQGSIFKLVTAYESLAQRYQELDEKNITAYQLNPLEIIDQTYRHGKENYVGYHIDGKPIPQLYKGGRMLKSSMSHIGQIDLLRALETSSNPYFSLLAGDVLKNPEDLARASYQFGYGQCTGIDLPAEIHGRVPDDLSYNRTGLYAMANGQHSLVVTPLQTAVMLSALANGGKVLKPKIVQMTAGRKPERNDPISNLDAFNHREQLNIIGLDFALFNSNYLKDSSSLVYRTPTVIKNQIFMPEIIRGMLLQGMKRVVMKQMRDGLASLSRFYKDYPGAISDYIELKDELFGKTSTAEAMENMDMDSQIGTNKYMHVWFGGILFNKDPSQKIFMVNDEFGKPQLVVVVYLKFGAWGKEAAPVAAQIIHKWKEIVAREKN